MKKLIATVCTTALVFGVMSMGQTYSRDCVVSSINGSTVILDSCGYTWEISGDGYNVGDTVTVKMSTCGTDSPDDDIVIGVK